ncbi:uncharacterized protein [Elaeis guineensis]|uniref:uncharacterized protein n=1 Tax=Elaeis guineensis var. tenera TaxID=51953 RepID=UPI003C6CD5F9
MPANLPPLPVALPVTLPPDENKITSLLLPLSSSSPYLGILPSPTQRPRLKNLPPLPVTLPLDENKITPPLLPSSSSSPYLGILPSPTQRPSLKMPTNLPPLPVTLPLDENKITPPLLPSSSSSPYLGILPSPTQRPSLKMPTNLPPLPVTLPLDENKITPPLLPSSSSSPYLGILPSPTQRPSLKMPTNLPPLPVTLPLDENKITPPLLPSSSSSSPYLGILPSPTQRPSLKMPTNLPPLPVTLPLDENKITPPLPPSSSSSPPPSDLPLMTHKQSAAATEIHDPLQPRPLSSASGDTVVIPEGEDEEERRAKEELKLKEEWVKEMRGWLMILATLAASVTYTAGLNPPGGFWQGDLSSVNGTQPHSSKNDTQPHSSKAGDPVLADTHTIRYIIFVACNDGALAMSIAIIVLLLNQSIFRAEVRLALLKACVVGDMFTLMMAFGAGSTRHSADIAGVALLSLSTFSYFFWWVRHFKKKPQTRRSRSSQERDVELGAIGQQTIQDPQKEVSLRTRTPLVCRKILSYTRIFSR